MKSIGLPELMMPPAIGLAFLVLSWPYLKAVSLGKPLTRMQKGILVYGFWFVFGSGYAILVPWKFGWGDWALAAVIVGWGAMIGSVAWWRSATRHR